MKVVLDAGCSSKHRLQVNTGIVVRGGRGGRIVAVGSTVGVQKSDRMCCEH